MRKMEREGSRKNERYRKRIKGNEKRGPRVEISFVKRGGEYTSQRNIYTTFFLFMYRSKRS